MMGFHGLQNQVKWRLKMSKAAELAKAGETLTNQPSGRKNIVTNGAMMVAQRSASETGLGAATGYFTLDRWSMREGAASAGRFTMAQVADGPSGFANCLKLTTTTADTSIAAGEFLFLSQRFEGQDLQQLKKGTSDAESVTVSFYVKGNAAATYVCELSDADNDRSITQAFTVTTDWVKKTLTFPGDTTGALNDDNALSLQLIFWLHGGSTYTSGTFSDNTWTSETSANRYAGSRTSIFDATSRTFFITGVQMEIGSQATPFEHRSFGQELALCQRYFEIHTTLVDFHMLAIAQAVSSTQAIFIMPFLVTKRTAPTVTFSASGTFTANTAGASNAGAATAIAVETSEIDAIRGILTVGSGLSAGNASFLQMLGSQDSAATVKLDSEL